MRSSSVKRYVGQYTLGLHRINCGIMRKDIQVSEQLVTCRFTLVFFLILEVAPRTVLGTGYHVP